jgi:opacity protein-like surface antigen
MKKFVKSAAIAGLLISTSVTTVTAGGGEDVPAPAANGWYMSALFGGPLPFSQDFVTETVSPGDYKPDWGIGGWFAIGRKLNEDWRADIAVSLVRGYDGKVKFDNGFVANFEGHSDVASVLLNAYRTVGRFDTRFGRIEAFLGAGIGFSHFDLEQILGAFNVEHTDTVFVGALHAGYDLKLSEKASIVSQYSLAYTGEAEFATVIPGASTVRDSRLDLLIHTGIRFALD